MFISTQVTSAYTFVTELSIIHSLNFSYKSGESHHTMHWAEHLPMPLYLNFLFCKGEILSTVKKPEPSWVWMVGLLAHTNLTFMSYHMHVLFSFYFLNVNVNVNAGRFYSVCSLDWGSHTTWTSHACKQVGILSRQAYFTMLFFSLDWGSYTTRTSHGCKKITNRRKEEVQPYPG